MLISELTFPHLLAEREAQLTRELERRRVVAERLEDAAPQSGRRMRHAPAGSSERMPRAGRETTGPRATDPCPA